MFRKRSIPLVLGVGLGCMLFALSILSIANDRSYEISLKIRAEKTMMLFEHIFNNANETDLDVGYGENATALSQQNLKYVTISFDTIVYESGLGNVLFEVFFLLSAASQLKFYKYFSRKRDVIRKLLEPTTKLKSGVEEEINKINDEDREKIRNNKVHKICIHIRRSDYIRNEIYWYTRSTFTLASANYLGEKYGINKSIAILAVGDSMDWANAVLSDLRDRNWTMIAFPRMDQVVTIALTQTYCDTLLLTTPTSTFGFWMAYTLKEGAHVYRGEDFSPPGGIENDTAIDDIAPPEWKVLRFNQSTLQVRELKS